MLILPCPSCGPRDVNEFRFGGEANPRPRDPSSLDDQAWSDYLYMRENKLGVQREWWYHSFGCGLWFLAKRNTHTNEVLRTYLWQSAARAAAPTGEATPGQQVGTQPQSTPPTAEA